MKRKKKPSAFESPISERSERERLMSVACQSLYWVRMSGKILSQRKFGHIRDTKIKPRKERYPMAHTITVHIGNSKKVNLRHNRRDMSYEQPATHINYIQSENNLSIENYKTVKEAYEDIFRDSCERYNNSKRKDRHKTPEQYYNEISNAKNTNNKLAKSPVYEAILQVGSKDSVKDDFSRLKCEKALCELYDELEAKFPNMKTVGYYVHVDETSIHAHWDYIPISHNNARGLDTQVSMNGALREMGYQGNTKEGFTEFRNAIRDTIASKAQEYSLEIDLSSKEHREHEEQEVFRLSKNVEALTTTKKELEQFCTYADRDLESKMNYISQLDNSINELEKSIEEYQRQQSIEEESARDFGDIMRQVERESKESLAWKNKDFAKAIIRLSAKHPEIHTFFVNNLSDETKQYINQQLTLSNTRHISR